MLFHIRCFLKIAYADLRSRLVHKLSPFLYIIGLMVMYLSSFIGNYIILTRFSHIGGWNYGQIILIYVFCLMSYGLRSVFFNQFTGVGGMIVRGELDRVMIRPVNTMVYLIGSRFEIGGFSHMTAGVILLIAFHNAIGITWSTASILMFIVALLCAALVQAAITIIIGGFAFFITENDGLRRLYEGFREFVYFPATIYSKAIQIILFCVVPLAFATYVPAALFLSNPEYDILSKGQWMLLLIGVTILLFSIACIFFNFGLKRYQSTGS